MFFLETIIHRDISRERLIEVIKLKQYAWNYPVEDQLSWIAKNLSSKDIHCILKKDSTPVAYMNLKDIEIIIDGVVYSAYGVGNVCSTEKGCGYGRKLMLMVNSYLLNNQKIGLLFCRNNLVDFYSRFDWYLISKDKMFGDYDEKGINTMSFNAPKILQELVYHGILF